MVKPHRLVLLACVAACLAYVYSCKSVTGRTVTRLSVPTVLAYIGFAVGGPLGIGLGAVAGVPLSDMFAPGPDPAPTNTTIIHNSPGGTVNTTTVQAGPTGWFATWWPWLLAVAFVIRFRAYLLGFVKTLATGGLKAAGMNLLALVAGGNVGAKAKAATSQHMIQRKYPRRPVSPQNPETFEGAPHV